VIGVSPARRLASCPRAGRLRPAVLAVSDISTDLRAELDAERLEARRAQARANEAARLSAAARDGVADRDKEIARLREQVGIVEESRQDLAAWAVKFAMKYHASYREHDGGMDPFEAIEEALAASGAALTSIAAVADRRIVTHDETFAALAEVVETARKAVAQ
jgi:phage-related tail protein